MGESRGRQLPTPILSGRRLGIYELQALIGAGGMGVVYRALDTNLNRPLAIKFLSDALADPASRRRFQREAQTAGDSLSRSRIWFQLAKVRLTSSVFPSAAAPFLRAPLNA